MSTRKRPLAELPQPQATPSRRAPTTPYAFNSTLQRTGARQRSVKSIRKANPDSVRPNSARGILRRLAKITAPVTEKRVITPTSINRDKENVAPEEADDDEAKIPISRFAIEESIEEDDSEIPVAPTPSALLAETDDELDQPTVTFDRVLEQVSTRDSRTTRRNRTSLIPHSDSALPVGDDEDGDDADGSTFLSERGRRAVSDEPTRMSRYSFGSMRMSEFGSELEIRRASDRQQKLAALEAEDHFGAGVPQDLTEGFGETENLRNLQPTPPRDYTGIDEVHDDSAINATFQLNIEDESDADAGVVADQRGADVLRPNTAVSFVEDEGGELVDGTVDKEAKILPQSSTRRQTFLESVAATARPSRKRKAKMNQRGNLVPSLPSSLIKKIIHQSQEQAGKRKTPLGKEHMHALEQATEWFFEQVGGDLEAYSDHSRSKSRIDPDDVLLLMRRQRKLQGAGELRKMAKDWLPRDVYKQLDLPE